MVAAIDRRTEVTAHLAEGSTELLLASGAPVDARRRVPGHELGELAGDQLDHLQAVAFLAGQRTGPLPTGRLEVSSTLPVGAGLSSSASVTAATAAQPDPFRHRQRRLLTRMIPPVRGHTQLPRVLSRTPSSRATCAIGRDVSITAFTAPSVSNMNSIRSTVRKPQGTLRSLVVIDG